MVNFISWLALKILPSIHLNYILFIKRFKITALDFALIILFNGLDSVLWISA